MHLGNKKWEKIDNLFYLDLGVEGLKSKAVELWENIVRLETEKYDLEERQKRQGYDVSSSLKLRSPVGLTGLNRDL